MDPIRWTLVITYGIFLQNIPAALVLQTAWLVGLIGLAAFGAAWVAVRQVVT